MAEDPLEARVRTVEADQRVHEAICAERYKGIANRLNIIMAGIGIILAAIAAGDPLVAFLKKLSGG